MRYTNTLTDHDWLTERPSNRSIEIRGHISQYSSLISWVGFCPVNMSKHVLSGTTWLNHNIIMTGYRVMLTIHHNMDLVSMILQFIYVSLEILFISNWTALNVNSNALFFLQIQFIKHWCKSLTHALSSSREDPSLLVPLLGRECISSSSLLFRITLFMNLSFLEVS